MFKTKITSQGTISIPAPLRKKFGLQAGDVVAVVDTGELVIKKTPSLSELRTQNQKYVSQKPGYLQTYITGDGMTAHLTEKYGSNKKK